MKLIRYEYPQLAPQSDFANWLDSAFAQFPRSSGLFDLFNFADSISRPSAGLSEDDDNYYARFELPGVKKDEITVEVKDNVLTVKASRQKEKDDQNGAFSLSRSISLTGGIDTEKIKANYEDGVLTVTLPRLEDRKPRNIELN